MAYLILVGVVVGIIAVCYLIMAVGLIQGKTFTSCGCASVTYKGEKIRCPGCPIKDEDEDVEGAEKSE